MAQATIEEFHAALSPEDRAMCEILHSELTKGLPGAEARMWHAHPVWFYGRNPIAGYSRLKATLRLMFWSGQSFPSPGLTASGSFKAAEIRFADVMEIDTAALAAWCRDAQAYQWDYANIVKRKGHLEKLVWP
ncbi:DUF1801 domain-containing protein [Roseobacteraceae bacterium S113]